MKEIALHEKVKIILSNRDGGVSKEPYNTLNLGYHVGDNEENVTKNREIFASYFDTPLKDLVFMNQVHSSSVLVINENGNYICDGVITKSSELVLCVMVADCAPVILYDSKNEVISALHVGRKGAFLGIITKAFNKMKSSFNTSCDDLYVYVGPRIKSCCYKIDTKVLKEAKKHFAYSLIRKGRDEYLDLDEIIFKELDTLGIQNIKVEKACTCCSKEYYSYRRDGITGRFGVGVKLL